MHQCLLKKSAKWEHLTPLSYYRAMEKVTVVGSIFAVSAFEVNFSSRGCKRAAQWTPNRLLGRTEMHLRDDQRESVPTSRPPWWRRGTFQRQSKSLVRLIILFLSNGWSNHVYWIYVDGMAMFRAKVQSDEGGGVPKWILQLTPSFCADTRPRSWGKTHLVQDYVSNSWTCYLAWSFFFNFGPSAKSRLRFVKGDQSLQTVTHARQKGRSEWFGRTPPNSTFKAILLGQCYSY